MTAIGPDRHTPALAGWPRVTIDSCTSRDIGKAVAADMCMTTGGIVIGIGITARPDASMTAGEKIKTSNDLRRMTREACWVFHTNSIA